MVQGMRFGAEVMEHPFGSDYVDLKAMAASLEAALLEIEELKQEVSTLKLQVNSMDLINSQPIGGWLPRNRSLSV